MILPTADTNDPDEPAESRMSATLARAEEAVANLAKDYANLALADVARARAALDAATGDPGRCAQHVEIVFRVGHDLKGQGTSFGYPLVTRIGHSLCALTRDRALAYEMRHLELARAHIDAIELVLTKTIKGDGGQTGAALVAKLEQRVAELAG